VTKTVTKQAIVKCAMPGCGSTEHDTVHHPGVSELTFVHDELTPYRSRGGQIGRAAGPWAVPVRHKRKAKHGEE
jgi:hypothetical protein